MSDNTNNEAQLLHTIPHLTTSPARSNLAMMCIVTSRGIISSPFHLFHSPLFFFVANVPLARFFTLSPSRLFATRLPLKLQARVCLHRLQSTHPAPPFAARWGRINFLGRMAGCLTVG